MVSENGGEGRQDPLIGLNKIMEYITRQKFSLRNQPFISLFGATVLLVEPEAEACAVFTRQLEGVHMKVISCGEFHKMMEQVEKESPDIVIVNPTHDIKKGVAFVESLKKKHPHVPVITIGKSIREGYLDAIMKAGVAFHLNRQFTQPRDLLLAVEQLLNEKQN